ncbi:energy transducer TonB [Oleiagrimonas soli]|uniref:TonB C-terminal domain-containing protein n=2 Tax=Oleiagrimonas soli TaxID=1543381 RepID=A0A841KEU2_9GAMM|nr:energy transducer TonB [Oleiagrimonas soli]MBB6183495.1 hypothetical protein [Oleiagrimonas soli]
MVLFMLMGCSLTWSTATRANPLHYEASMVVKGAITISPQGSVTAYTLEQPDKLPKAVTGLLAKAVPHWRFEPVRKHGTPVAAESPMRVRIVAVPLADKRYDVRVASTWFPGTPSSHSAGFRREHRQPPRYPVEMVRSGVSGTAFLILRVGRDGNVEKAAAEHVDLMTRGGTKQMAHWRELFARSALNAARTWHFTVPTEGPKAKAPYWDVRVPVRYRSGRNGHPPINAYGSWTLFIPGPLQPIPWRARHTVAGKHVPDDIRDMGIVQRLQRLPDARS